LKVLLMRTELVRNSWRYVLHVGSESIGISAITSLSQLQVFHVIHERHFKDGDELKHKSKIQIPCSRR
jgi:hypothetical protein